VHGAYPKRSDRWIADACGVSHPFVAKVRAQLVTVTTTEGEGEREGADGKTRRAPSFDAERETAHAERTIATLAERWPSKERARFYELVTAWLSRVEHEKPKQKTSETPKERASKPAKAKNATNGVKAKSSNSTAEVRS
jgi:hypothetical protein